MVLESRGKEAKAACNNSGRKSLAVSGRKLNLINIVFKDILNNSTFCKYYLQHERPCCISIYKLEPKTRIL